MSLYLIKYCVLIRMRFIDIKSLLVIYYQQFDRSMGLWIINDFFFNLVKTCLRNWLGSISAARDLNLKSWLIKPEQFYDHKQRTAGNYKSSADFYTSHQSRFCTQYCFFMILLHIYVISLDMFTFQTFSGWKRSEIPEYKQRTHCSFLFGKTWPQFYAIIIMAL